MAGQEVRIGDLQPFAVFENGGKSYCVFEIKGTLVKVVDLLNGEETSFPVTGVARLVMVPRQTLILADYVIGKAMEPMKIVA